MRRTYLLWVSAVLLVFCSALAHADTLINPSFETGTSVGWTDVGNIIDSGGWGWSVDTFFDGNIITYNPQVGSYLLDMDTLGNASLEIYQAVNLNVGDTLTGWAAFLSFGETANGVGAVEILNGATVIATPWTENVASLGTNTDGPWTPWSWTAPSVGTYRLRYSVVSDIGGDGPTFSLFDAPLVDPAPVPEPGTLALLLLGLPGLAWLRRRKA